MNILSVSFSSKCCLFHHSNVFGSCIIHILYTGCANIEKNNSGEKSLKSDKNKGYFTWRPMHLSIISHNNSHRRKSVSEKMCKEMNSNHISFQYILPKTLPFISNVKKYYWSQITSLVHAHCMLYK